MEAAAIIGLVTAVLQLLAIAFLIVDIRETRRTTSVMEEMLRVAREDMKAGMVASDELREATFISQLQIKWESFEVHESVTFALSLSEDPRKAFESWEAWGGDRLDSYNVLEVPRFFETLYRLIERKEITERMAVLHFGNEAVRFWKAFEPLVTRFRELGGEFRRFSFDGFEELAGTAKLYPDLTD